MFWKACSYVCVRSIVTVLFYKTLFANPRQQGHDRPQHQVAQHCQVLPRQDARRIRARPAIVAATTLSEEEQTRGRFVHELLDKMVNSEAKTMVKDIVSYVGLGASSQEVVWRGGEKAKTGHAWRGPEGKQLHAIRDK